MTTPEPPLLESEARFIALPPPPYEPPLFNAEVLLAPPLVAVPAPFPA